MKRWLLALLLVPLLAEGARAGPQPIGPLTIVEPSKPRYPRFNFRLVDDSNAAPAPIHNSGMIAQTRISPNASLGIGILKAAPKKFGEPRPEPYAPRSRKAAVRFVLKF